MMWLFLVVLGLVADKMGNHLPPWTELLLLLLLMWGWREIVLFPTLCHRRIPTAVLEAQEAQEWDERLL